MAVPLLLVPALLAAGLAGLTHALPQTASGPPAQQVPAELHSPAVIPAAFSPVFTPEVARWSGEILRWSGQYELPPEVIATVMQIESCGDPHALSSAGAQGLFQVMPFHFSAAEQPTDPQVNARRGLDYLARSMQLAGDDLAAGFAGYNAGHGVIARPPSEWPTETIRYVAWATGILQEARAGIVPSPTLQAWLTAGGAYLCRQAASVAAPLDA
jgi:soluble lytic murein transglycosylase-like protein